MITKRDFRCLAWLGALLLIQFAPVLFTGRGYFLRDLTYINHPWRALAAQELAAGRLPLWDPYASLGLPLAANLQSEVFYPFSVPFALFDFPSALKVFHLLHFGLAGLLAYLWLRSWRLGRTGCAAAAAAFMLGGPLLSRLEFLNLLAVIALAPALALFARRPALLALALALGFLAGHPQAFAALAAVCFCLAPGRRWAPAAALGAAACAVLAFPAVEMILQSARAGGLDPAVRLAHSLSLPDLPGLLTAWAVPADPGGARYEWWRAIYIGLAGFAALGFGFRHAGRRARIVGGGLAAAALLVCLGGSTPPSAWLWEHFPPLHFVRYPANFGFLITLPLLPLLALGARRRPVLAFLVGAELLIYGCGISPTEPAAYWADRGPNVLLLDRTLGGHRFFLSPRASAEQRGLGRTLEESYLDIKHRLHGLSFIPYRLAAAGGDGEPLVPAGAQAALDYAQSRPSAEAALAPLAWLDVRTLLRPGPDPRVTLWDPVAVPGAAGAAFLPAAGGLPGSWPGVSPPRHPLESRTPRPDALEVAGAADTDGFVVLSRGDYPGWSYWVDGAPAAPLRAFGSFPALSVPGGPFSARARYRPASVDAGLALTLAVLIAASIYLYNRARRGVRAF